MNESDIFLRILLTVVFGAILGLETETRISEGKSKKLVEKEERQRIGGIRTYTILSLIGGVSGVFFNAGLIEMVYIIFAAIILLVLAAYVLNVQMQHAFGLTTEIAILISFLIGFLTTSAIVPISVCLFILVILAFFLSQKRGIGKVIEKIEHDEIIDVFKFGLISLVVLPLLPNETYTINDVLTKFELTNLASHLSSNVLNLSLINPFRIWFIVVIVSGINLAGYLLQKVIGQSKSLATTAFVGGLISSTSTVASLAEAAKNDEKESKKYAGAALIAHGVSFITCILLISILNFSFLKEIYLALLAFFAISTTIGFIFIVTSKTPRTKNEIKLKKNHFQLSPAIRFVSLIVSITLLIQVLQLIDVDVIAIGVTALSGFTGMDPAIIAISELLNDSEITLKIATLIFMLTNLINFIGKVGIGTVLGNRSFSKYLGVGLLITAIGNMMILV
jgi:uncharacterized membrane protein (DUF4010 family)